VILAAPFALSYAAAFSHTNRPAEPASLFTLSTAAIVALAICAVVVVVSLERKVERGGAAKLRANGQDPDRFLLNFGVISLFTPAGLAAILWILGLLAAGIVYACCTFSFSGICLWGWRYRGSISPAA
jgi:hypothetical protein